jgi:hypothetical protein
MEQPSKPKMDIPGFMGILRKAKMLLVHYQVIFSTYLEDQDANPKLSNT